MPFSFWAAAAAALCPAFVEFMPDPADTADAAGEYVEIRLFDDAQQAREDTLFVRFEDKAEMPFASVVGTRLLLHRDLQACPPREDVDCRELTSAALPNSREMFWSLRYGDCIDSAYLPVPKAGKALQRSGDAYGDWVHAVATPGVPNADFERGIDDCGISLAGAVYRDGAFEIGVSLENCDSTVVHYESETLDLSARKQADSLKVRHAAFLKIPSKGIPEHFRAWVPRDEVAANDSLDTLLIAPEHSPLQITEVHFCPQEGESEWIEIYNALPRALRMNGISLCARGKVFGDSVLPYESVLLTKDTAALRAEIGFRDARILRAGLGTLKNAGDTLCLCYGEDTLATVVWGKAESAVCPAGFNPQSGRRENTPGFQGRGGAGAKPGNAPFTVELSARSASRRERNPVRVRVSPGEAQLIAPAVTAVLLTENGRPLWEQRITPNANAWFELPVLDYEPGVYFFKCVAGRYEKTFGIVVKP